MIETNIKITISTILNAAIFTPPRQQNAGCLGKACY